MPIAYHIDRSLQLHKEEVLNLIPIPSNGLGKDQMEIHGIYEISQFAKNHVYYYDNILNGNFIPTYANANSIQMDMMLESYRKLINPLLPSRFQCLYACENIEEVMKWITYLKLQNYKVWKIEYDTIASKLDAKFLSCDSFSAGDAQLLMNYWEQKISNDPLFELLIPLPVKVLEDVTQLFDTL